MSTFTEQQLETIRAYARQLAVEHLSFPVVRSEQREEATEALTRWLFDHRARWAFTIFEEPRRLIAPNDPANAWLVVDRFFDEFIFDQVGHAVPKSPWLPRADQRRRNETN